MNNNSNEKTLYQFFKLLYNKLQNEEYVIDKTGVKMVEIIAPRIELDPTSKFLEFNGRKTPRKYVEKELAWYDSQDLSVKEIGKVAKIWNSCADINGEVNSNYGFLVYNKSNYSQYDNTLNELKKNRESRRAVMIYNRPSMHYDYNKFGRNDFVCTFAHQFFIRNNKLNSVVNMRSNDGIFGAFSDFPWFATIQERLLKDVQEFYPEVEMGKLIHIPNSFHVYERHFDMLKTIVEENKEFEND